MNVYEKLGLKTIINASDVYTIIGGSRMDRSVVEAMAEASRHFVDIADFARKASDKIAELTRNEACCICAGAAAGILVSAAACMTGLNEAFARQLPVSEGMKNEFLVFRDQLNEKETFLHMIETAGGKMVVVDPDPRSMEAAIGEKTAGVFYYPHLNDFESGFSLESIIILAHLHQVPVVFDAAAMLPPVSNFWHWTKDLGADAIIFSGGKHIAGPQSTGLILGKRDLIEACRLNCGPAVRVARPAKVGKEEIAGILAAVELFTSLDFNVLKTKHYQYLQQIENGLAAIPGIWTEIRSFGTLQQDYPLLVVTLPEGIDGHQLHLDLREGFPSIDIRDFFWKNISNQIFINPYCLQPDEPEIIIRSLREYFLK